MDLWTIIKVVFRRWYAVFPILVLTAVAAYQIAYKAPPTYEASGSALLVAPNIVTSPTGTVFKQNPYLLFSGSLNITAAVVVRILNDTIERDTLFKAGLLADYEVGADQSSPAIGVRAEGDTAEVVVDTVGRLLDDVEKNLRDLQNAADAPQDLRIGVEFLVRPSQAQTLRGKVARTMATIGVLGGLLAVGVALLWEAAASSRKRTKAAAAAARLAAEAEEPEVVPEPEEEQEKVAADPPAKGRRRRAAARAAPPEAEEAAAAEAEEAAPAAAPVPRRGRRKKAAAQDEVPAAEAEEAAPAAVPAPRRGRKKKAAAQDDAPADGPPEVTQATPELAATADGDAPPPRRRSRKRPAPEVVESSKEAAEPQPDEVAEPPVVAPADEPEPPRRRRSRRVPPVVADSTNGTGPHPDATESLASKEAEAGTPVPVD